MKILTLITLMACAMISAYGQNFTNTINQVAPDGKQNLSVSYNDQSHKTISNPLELYVDLTVFGAADTTSLEGTLQHKGVTYDVFSFGESVSSGIFVFPTTDFVGQDGQGSWNFTLTDNRKDGVTVELNQWGIMTVPEPSAGSIILFGLVCLLLTNSKKKLHS